MTRLSAHRRMFEAAIAAQYVTNQKSLRAVTRGDWAESDRQRARCARWCNVTDRLLGWMVPSQPTDDTALIPRSEIAAALAAHTQEICS